MFLPRIKPITQKRLSQLEKARGNSNNREWRSAVLARDGNKCQYPGCEETKKLQVHHIRRFANNRHLRTAVFNGITLCKGCHQKIYNREHEYELLFFNIVKAKKNESNH